MVANSISAKYVGPGPIAVVHVGINIQSITGNYVTISLPFTPIVEVSGRDLVVGVTYYEQS